MAKKLKIGLILGTHPFDTINMYPMFWGMESLELYPQLSENLFFDYGGNNSEYDGYVFYNMDMETPDPGATFGDSPYTPADTFYKLGEDGKGLVVLHHALLAWPQCAMWSELVGIEQRSFDYFPDTEIGVRVVDREHPITRGLAPAWTVVDETYAMAAATEPDSHILVETDCAKSMRTLAWTRTFRKSNVFCLALGHDRVPFADKNFAALLERGIRWSCGAL